MRFVQTYDRLMAAFYWPVVVNAIAGLIAIPAATFTDWLPAPIWYALMWVSVIVAGTQFILALSDGRVQRAVRVFPEVKYKNGTPDLIDYFSEPIVPQRTLSVLWKLTVIQYIIFGIIAMWGDNEYRDIILTHGFSIACSVLGHIFLLLKYDPELHGKAFQDDPYHTNEVLPIAPPAPTAIGLALWCMIVAAVIAAAYCGIFNSLADTMHKAIDQG
ncbi:hypothetical protein [Asticcacaulis machinosus]|uniref:Uncharacterized protein n=1 Tax=Asticcacaulis machinosus TaxID=2984211 RepID=A0ABT5HL46_9CAUL|nr:hypothetical protein [Asticcacaulis machinosus]MDC7676969.1 hypothetical protein [Asticcacaulis machinosus]